MKIAVARGDIVDVDLSGAIGVEKMNDVRSGGRPCIVVQNNVGNRFSPMTIVVPLTDMEQFKDLPVQVPVTAEELGFQDAKASVVECGHVRSIDGDARVRKHLGRLDDAALKRVDQAVRVSLGL